MIRIIAALSLSVAVIVVTCCGVAACPRRINFSRCFYYVCYDSPSDAHSASSVSSVVESYGGAGYILQDGQNYYIAVSCYYNENDADGVCAALNNNGLKCRVVAIEACDYVLRGGAGKNAEQYEGNLKTLTELSEMCYNLANSLDNYSLNQSGAKSVLADIKTGLESRSRRYIANCFSGELARLTAECDDVSQGYILARDVRRLQIAITDAVVNVNLY